MNNHELLQIVEKIILDRGMTINEMVGTIGVDRSNFSTLINSETTKKITKRLYGKMAKAFPAYFENTTKATDVTVGLSGNIKDSIILQLVESNRKLVDNTVDLTQMAKENWAKSAAVPKTYKNEPLIDETVLRLLARAVSHGKFQNEQEAMEYLKEDFADLTAIREKKVLLAEKEAQNARTRSAGAKMDQGEGRKIRGRGMSSTQER